MLKKYVVWLLAAALFVSLSCTSAPANDDLVGQIDAVQEAAVSESYLIKRMQANWANKMAYMFWVGGFIEWTYPSHSADGEFWAKGNQKFWWYGGPGCDADDCAEWSITFTDPRYTSDTRLQYGHPKILKNALENEGGKSDCIDNREGSDDDEHEIDQSFTIDHEESSTLSKDFSADITTSSSTTVGVGAEVGPKFEETLSVTFGAHFGSAEEKSKTDSTSTTQEYSDTQIVEAGKHTCFTFSTRNEHLEIPFQVDGFLDWGFTFTLPTSDKTTPGPELQFPHAFWQYIGTNENLGWRNRKQSGASSDLTFASVIDFERMTEGTNTDWPQMAGWLKGGATAKGISPNWKRTETFQLVSPHSRLIQLTGTQQRIADSAVTLTILDVTGCTEVEFQAIESKLQTTYEITDEETHGLSQGCVSGVSSEQIWAVDRTLLDRRSPVVE